MRPSPKSIQKQVKSIDVDKIGSKKHLASKSVSFRVELIASSFLDLIFKKARLNTAVSGFMLLKVKVDLSLVSMQRCTSCDKRSCHISTLRTTWH